MASKCGAGLVVSAISGDGAGHRSQAATAGQLVVTTPAKIAQMLQQGWVTGEMLEQRLQVLVLDEADLLLSYGYEEDVQLLAPQVSSPPPTDVAPLTRHFRQGRVLSCCAGCTCRNV